MAHRQPGGAYRKTAVHMDCEPKPPRFVKLADASKRLGLGRTAIFDLFNKGELTRVKLSERKTVVLEQELSDYIQRKFDEASRVTA